MDPNLVKKISQQTYRRFPEMTGVQPKVRKQPAPPAQSNQQQPQYLLIYQTQVSGPGAVSIPRWVRVIADVRGRIIKTTTSK
ncbi:MAG: hypothetical protein JW862_02755 [Anaerolineales bacterium]|nr:hypothetical protein [Anaerolineales bacterium]